MTHITFQGKQYIEMPYLIHGECEGCALQDDAEGHSSIPCPHTENIHKCNEDSPILVEDTPEDIARYVAKRLEQAS